MNRPYTFINVAMTADGKIDTFERRGAAISSQKDKQRVDELRALSDAILVGGQTLLEEQPKLTVKSEALRESRVARGASPNPIKVGVVTNAQLHSDSKFLMAGPAKVVIFTTEQTSNEQVEFLRSMDVQVFVHHGARVDLVKMMDTLKKTGVDHLMVEGGGTMNFELMRLGLVDEVMIYVAPLLFGGAGSPTLADGTGFMREQALALKLAEVQHWEDGGVLLRYKI